MIEILLEEDEARLVIMDLNTIRKLIYKEGSEYWNTNKRIEGYIKHELEKKAIKEEQ